jgi:hypothetical protein
MDMFLHISSFITSGNLAEVEKFSKDELTWRHTSTAETLLLVASSA